MKKLILLFCLLLETTQITFAMQIPAETTTTSWFTRISNSITQFFSQSFFQNIQDTIRNFFRARPVVLPKSPPIQTSSVKLISKTPVIPEPVSTQPPGIQKEETSPSSQEEPKPAQPVSTEPPTQPFPTTALVPIMQKRSPINSKFSIQPSILKRIQTKYTPSIPAKMNIRITPSSLGKQIKQKPISQELLLTKEQTMSLEQPMPETTTQTIPTLFIQLKHNLEAITHEEPDTINSPEIKKEKLLDFSQIIHTLDTALKPLPQEDQLQWHKNIQNLINPAQQNIKTLVMDVMQDEWNHRGKEILEFTIGITRAAMTSAAIPLLMQAAQIGTGNLADLDTSAAIISGLSSAAAFALSQYQEYLAIAPTTASNIVTQAIITPSIITRNFSIAIPSVAPSLNYWLLSEGITIASRFMQNNDKAIQQTLNNIDLKNILFGKESTANTMLAAQASPSIHNVVKSENAKYALITIGGTVFQAAIIGGLLYLTGLGYTDTSMLQSMGYAVLTAVAQETVAQVANIRHNTEPGALINITAAPFGQQLFAIAGGTSQAAASAVLQAAATEISNILVEESAQQESGLRQIFKQATTDVQSGVKSLWSSLATGWYNVTQAFTPLEQGEFGRGGEDY